MKKFEPVIVGFVCNECMYAAADLAGTTRLSYPSNIRLIRVPCSGQVDMIHILRAFENGADGVFVGGCLKDQCHYVDGNIKADKRVDFLREVLKAMGLEEERLGIHLMSASMGREFAELANELTLKLKKLGPSPLKRQKRSITDIKKREMFRDMLLSISARLDTKSVKYNYVFPGFADVLVDEKKCVGCGACDYVCKDGAMAVETKDDKLLIKNTYWKCTACGMCQDACPKDCLEVKEGFDLKRFLGDEKEIKAEVEMSKCERCGKSFSPLMLARDIETMLADRTLSGSFIGICPSCRKFIQAEKIRDTQASSKRMRGKHRVEGGMASYNKKK